MTTGFDNVFSRTLAVLALFDGIFNLCDILNSIRKIYYNSSSCLPMNYFQMAHIYLFPIFLYPLQKIAMTSSIYTTVVLAFERCKAVSRPISTFVNDGRGTTKRVILNIGLVLLFSIIFNLPNFFEFYVQWCTVGCLDNYELPIKEYDARSETFEEFKERVQHNMTAIMEFNASPFNDTLQVATKFHFHWNGFRRNPHYILYYINIAQNLVTGFIPLIFLGIVNSCVYLHLAKRRKEVAFLTKGNIVLFKIYN